MSRTRPGESDAGPSSAKAALWPLLDEALADRVDPRIAVLAAGPNPPR